MIADAGLMVAAAAAIAMLYFVVSRLRSDRDPSLRYRTESASGSASVLISGAHVTMLLGGLVVGGTFVAGLFRAEVLWGVLLLVVAHWLIEQREAMAS